MIEITVNGQSVELEGAITLKELAGIHMPEANFFIVDEAVVDSSFIITRDDTEVRLIRRGLVSIMPEMDTQKVALDTVMKKSTVGIAGLGGLGSHVAVALARSGIGRIIGIDFDIVEPSNITRQYYFIEQIGMKKIDALKSTISRVNQDTITDFHDLKITENNVKGLFTECDVIIEAFDKSNSKVMFFDAWQKYYPDKYYIGASGIAGFIDEPPLSVRKIGERGFLIGDMTTDMAEGLVASRVGIAANMQANLAVKLLVGIFA